LALDWLCLNGKGQVTVEFILILVIMLTILATVSMPAVDDVTKWVDETSTVVSLAAAQRRIINTAEELSMAGCGSYKNIGVYVDPVHITYREASVVWDSDYVWGSFTNATGDTQELVKLHYPDYIKISVPVCAGGCCVVNNTYVVRVEKDCSTSRPTVPAGIGGVCW